MHKVRSKRFKKVETGQEHIVGPGGYASLVNMIVCTWCEQINCKMQKFAFFHFVIFFYVLYLSQSVLKSHKELKILKQLYSYSFWQTNAQ